MVRGVGPKASALGIGVTWRFMVVRSTGISKITRAPCLPGVLRTLLKAIAGPQGGFGGLWGALYGRQFGNSRFGSLRTIFLGSFGHFSLMLSRESRNGW